MGGNLRQALKERLLVGDGAIGTYLYQLGVPVGSCLEELNITRPELVEQVHREYLLAGAHLLETNTFTANRERLARYNLGDRVRDVNRAAVERAREAIRQVESQLHEPALQEPGPLPKPELHRESGLLPESGCRPAQGPLPESVPLRERPGENRRPVFVLGAVGGIRGSRPGTLTDEVLAELYREQMAALLEAGVDGLVLETFVQWAELRLAVQVARQLDDAVPLIAQLSVQESGRTEDGVSLTDAFALLRDEGADVVGLNCSSGPHTMLRLLEREPLPRDIVLSAYPNAGLPGYQDGRFVYPSSPAYFADRALEFWRLGARIIGGCCGTTPEHIAAVARVLAHRPPQPVRTVGETDGPERSDSRLPDGWGRPQAEERMRALLTIAVPPADETALHARDCAGREWDTSARAGADRGFGLSGSSDDAAPPLTELVRQRVSVIVELDPPRDLDISRYMEGAAVLKEAGIDALTMADNSLAMTRMSNMALGAIVKERLGLRPLLHMACRDRNWIGQQSHLMGLHALGIDHVLAVTGDPTRHGDLPGAASVYDGNSFDLIRMIKQLNDGLAFSGQPLKSRARFTVGAAFNPNVRNWNKAMERLERKVACGADFIMTQPIYDPALFEQLYRRTRHLDVPIFVGVMPLVSYRNALFLHHEVPGIQLSEQVLARMSRVEGEDARREGVAIAKELLDEALRWFNGIYLMTPFLRYEMTAELTRYVLRKAAKARRRGHESEGRRWNTGR